MNVRVSIFGKNSIDDFFKHLKGKKVAFAGISRSNLPLVDMFRSRGINTIVCDAKSNEAIQKIADTLSENGSTVILGENYLSKLVADVVFRTPGINFYNPELQNLRNCKTVVTSEMEIFFDFCPCEIIAVTGSDGKTTTTTLIAKILEHSGKKVHIGGNIGNPLLQRINDISVNDMAVVELSSFQLISMRNSPDTAVVTNISPNHLDVHKDMQEYIDAKKNILLHQNAFSSSVINLDNSITKKFTSLVRGKLLGFTMSDMSNQHNFNGTYLRSDGVICMSDCGKITPILHKDEIKIPGLHNVENYLAAISAVWSKVSINDIVDVAKNFSGVPHRMEFVAQINGVKYYNDSIASSPTRTIKGTLSLYDQKIILICGGYDKKISFTELGEAIAQKVKVLILLGQTSSLIEDAVRTSKNSAQIKIIHVNTMQDAVSAARNFAVNGDIVSLSPACASFDMYKDFEARGNHFKEIVGGLTK